jgi:hypothetical protein
MPDDTDPDPDPPSDAPAPQPDQPQPKRQDAGVDQPAPRAELVDDSAGKIGTPDDPNVPEDSPIKAEETPAATQERYIKHQIGIQQRAAAEARAQAARTQQGYKDLEAQVTELGKTTPPAPIPLEQRPQEQRKANLFLSYALPTALALGVAAFGSRGKGYLMADFLGGAMKGYAEGRTEQQKLMTQKAEEQRRQMHEINQDREKSYHDILNDKKYSITQKMDLMRLEAESNHDAATLRAAETGDLKTVMEQMRKSHAAAKQSATDAMKALIQMSVLTGDPSHGNWLQELRKRYKADNGHEAKDPMELLDEGKAYPYETFLKDRGRETDKKDKENPEDKDDPLHLHLPSQKKTSQADEPSDTQTASTGLGDINGDSGGLYG